MKWTLRDLLGLTCSIAGPGIVRGSPSITVKGPGLLVAFVASALLLAGCDRESIGYDGGGEVGKYQLAVVQAWRDVHNGTSKGMRLTRDYDSAALYYLSGPVACISPAATFGAHEVRTNGPNVYRPLGDPLHSFGQGAPIMGGYATGVRSEVGTQLLRLAIPECARRLFDEKKAFDGPRITVIPGKAILDACPQIQACS